MIPDWFHFLSIAWLTLGGWCALMIVVDLIHGHRQQMGIMNVVWPVSALFGTVVALAAYYRWGRLATHRLAVAARQQGQTPPAKRATPFPIQVGKGATHCGSACALADLGTEGLVLMWPVVATWFGWRTWFADRIFAVWILDFVAAFALGILFQYLAIKPMRHLSVSQGLVRAVKADTLSLTAWQLGMYGWMAIAHFVIFARLWGVQRDARTPEFWFMMQIAMLFGFAVAYPANWWLIRRGIKEAM